MTTYYKQPILLIEFNQDKSFLLQVFHTYNKYLNICIYKLICIFKYELECK